MVTNTKYEEISRAKVSKTRSIVISDCSRGGYTLAQQMETIEMYGENEGKKTTVFLKGAFHVSDIDGLYNLRDAINLAIRKIEEQKENDESNEEGYWDDEVEQKANSEDEEDWGEGPWDEE